MRAAATLALAACLLVAAVVDARTRRLPHGLAVALLIAASAYALAWEGPGRLAVHMRAALVVVAALMAFELAWRRRRGAPGQGAGDLKALGALMVAAPVRTLLAYAGALALLALGCVIAQQRALPLLPFLVPCFLLALAI